MRIGEKGTLVLLSVCLAARAFGEPHLTLAVKPVYRYRADGQPGREVEAVFEGGAPGAITQADVGWSGQTGVAECSPVKDAPSRLRVLLPPGLGERRAEDVVLAVNVGGAEVRQALKVPALRHWTVYLYNHSHVDIGYSVTQETAEFLHARNVEEGVRLAEATRGAPDGSRFQWNPEVTWPIERLWQAAPEKREGLLRALREGLLAADASYVHINTSTCSDEELFHLFGFGHELSLRSGVRVETMQQVDVPGASWGLLPVMAQLGVRYLMMWPNTCRAGHAHDGVDGRPFWWVGPDGVSKVLVLQPGCYANSGSMKKGGETGRPWFGQRDRDRIPAVIRTGRAEVDFTAHVANLEAEGYPYDFAVLSWSLWDNSPPDADVPDAVRAWNAEVAFPHIVMAGGTAIMREIEAKYGKQVPTKRGDFTEYWTDGLGSAARLIAGNRNAKERLVQAETLWALLRPGKPAPRGSFDDAWRYVMLGSEHTWCAENPEEPYFQEAIWEGKQRFFREADERSRRLLDDALAPATDTSRGALGPAEGPAEGGVAVFNTQAWAHGGLVALKRSESRRGDRVTDEEGREVPSQRLASGELAFLAARVPAFGASHFRVSEGACGQAASACRVSEGVLENGALRVGVDLATGCVTQLVVLATGRDYADPEKGGGLNAFRWMPGDSDDAKPDHVTKTEIVERGPLVVELRSHSEAPGCRSVSRSVRLVSGQPWVEFGNVVDKLPLEAKDGVHFGFGFRVAKPVVRVDIPWGVMRVETDQLPEANRNWLALQRWLDVSCDSHGATWCSLDAPLFECGDMTANQTGTWQGERKPWLRRLEPSAAVYSWVMNNHWFTNFPLTQEGPVAFRYRVLPHEAFSAADANRFGVEQAQPLVHVAASRKPDVRPPVALDNPRVTVTILRPEADGETLTARLRSLSDRPEDVHVSYPAAAPVSVSLCDAAGERQVEAGAALKLPPYGCASISIRLSAARHAASAP